MDLKTTQARDLDKFIETRLLPDTPFRLQVKRAVHIISSFLKERCFQSSPEPVRVSKVVKGGSSGKGTSLRGRSDADLVVFLNNLRSFRDQYDRRAEFIREIRRQLEACQRERSFEVTFQINPHSNPRSLSFELRSRAVWQEESVEFDILPAYDALGQWTKGQRPDPQIYVMLIKECRNLGKENEFSPCFTELQRAFLKERPTKLKSLIRLVKYWFQMCRSDLKKPLPPQYALELLTVYAWEQGSRNTDFSTAQGFRTVLTLILKYEQFCIFWEKYYDFTHPYIGNYLEDQLSKPRPVILDPADPTCNVAGGSASHDRWENLARAAETWLCYPCFRNWDGSLVYPWEVPPALKVKTRSFYANNTEVHILNCSEYSRDYPREYPRGYPREYPRESPREYPREYPRFPKSYTPCPPPVEEGWSCSILTPSGEAAAGRCRPVRDMDVYRTPAGSLDSLVASCLLPPSAFERAARRALGALGAALQERRGLPGAQWSVQKIVKGGSSGRGTALRGGCDAELIIFLDCFKSYEDQGPLRPSILREMRAVLEAWRQEPLQDLSLELPTQNTPGLVQFRLASPDSEHWMDVSLVPAFDALGPLSSGAKPEPRVYSTLLDSGCPGGEHAACFAELRRNFVNTRPAKLKNLLLLVKHWYRQVLPPGVSREQLPPAYALELLTIFAWEQGCGQPAFSLAQGLRTVLGLLQRYQHLCVFWTLNYGFEDPVLAQLLQRQLQRPRPVILDPADPTWDVGGGPRWRWDVLAQEAESCFNQPCFLQAAGSCVQPWDGHDLPRSGCPGLDHPIHPVPVPIEPQDSRSHETVGPGVASAQPPRPAPSTGTLAAPSAPATGSGLGQVPAKQLDRFIEDHLRPSPQSQRLVGQALDGILRHLQKHSIHKASRACKGGSFGRGTDLRDSSDAELILFVNGFKNHKDQESRRAEVLDEMRAQLESLGSPAPGLSLKFREQQEPGDLKFQLVPEAAEGGTDVSLLPVFDALGPLSSGAKPEPRVYSTLLDSGCPGGEHAACFAELRRNFVNTRPAKLKNLLLLVKHWYRQVAARKEGQSEGASLPCAYALELLTIYAWEQGCKKDQFHMAQGLATVLGLVQQHPQLCVYWTVNYDLEDPALRMHLLRQLHKPRPLILDPADPSWNVAQGNWELLAQEAAALRTEACLMNSEETPVAPWDVMPALLSQTPAGGLDKFISDFLQPDRRFLAQVNKAVDIICAFLRDNCFRGSTTKVLKVVKGGSSAKGTALRGRSDADLVVFLSCFGHFTEQGSRRAEIISEIRRQLEACQRAQQFEVAFEISKWDNPRVLSFSLSSRTLLDQSVDFDVLPAFDALGQLVPGSRPSPQVYLDLIHSYHNAGEFSCCFTERQRDFISMRPTKLKSLIRLVKHWYRQCSRMPSGRGSLPPQHGLELLTVYAWEQGSGDQQFSMAEGFRTVLELVTQYRQLCIYWTTNYDNQTLEGFLEQQLQKPRPIILDPADPTGNLGQCARWDLLAKEATAYMSAPCCLGRDGKAIEPWPVKAAVCRSENQ
ncbi:2'-5'-oligoadenylate synthase 3-like [Sorex fumeus]|uniref:2'-5'-oligoadenylate synthase 3-like n=1 Tax=Sorex fumeus TaxID=62283 RepID=UPI0024ACB6BF|nr:2'-5'-oligoadenylate synthase 3-like [Sorex fumeus]